MPAEDDKWMNLIRIFGRASAGMAGGSQHLVLRGLERTESSLFLRRNPGGLFSSLRDDSPTLKDVDGCFRWGGPANFCQCLIPEFRSFCEEHQVPLILLPLHHYPSDDPLSTMGMNGPGVRGHLPWIRRSWNR